MGFAFGKKCLRCTRLTREGGGERRAYAREQFRGSVCHINRNERERERKTGDTRKNARGEREGE